jgi:hypothetical protein
MLAWSVKALFMLLLLLGTFALAQVAEDASGWELTEISFGVLAAVALAILIVKRHRAGKLTPR